MPEAGSSRTRNKVKREQGFSLIEVIVAIGIIMIVTAMAIVHLNPTRQQLQANGAMYQLASQLRLARELAITRRRYIQVEFLAGNQIRLTQLAIGVMGAPTVISTVPIEAPIAFTLTPGAPDTPDLFGNLFPIEFQGLNGGPPIMMFQSDGSFVSGTGNLLNGTVFMGMPNVNSAGRAVTVVGSTGRIRMYRYTGTAWIQ